MDPSPKKDESDKLASVCGNVDLETNPNEQIFQLKDVIEEREKEEGYVKLPNQRF